MLISNIDLDLLKLCGLSRYLPRDFTKKYKDIPALCRDRASLLVEAGIIKEVRAARICYRLTGKGRDVLRDFGYDFPDDVRTNTKGNSFNRRIISAELNVMMYGAGIDVFAPTVERFETKDRVYVPTLTIRAETKSSALAGTRFHGILRAGTTVYVFYHADKGIDGIFPQYEENTFNNIVSGISTLQNIVIVLTGRTTEGLLQTAFPKEDISLSHNLTPFSKLLEGWHYEFRLLPMSTDGILQLRLLNSDYIREDILAGLTDIRKYKNLSFCDGVSNGMAYIIGLDMNVTRVRGALNQLTPYELVPNIICLDYQTNMYQSLAVSMKYKKQIKFTAISNDSIIETYPNLKPQYASPAVAQLKNGGLIEI